MTRANGENFFYSNSFVQMKQDRNNPILNCDLNLLSYSMPLNTNFLEPLLNDTVYLSSFSFLVQSQEMDER